MFPFMDLRSGARWTVRPNAGRLPWWVLAPGRRVPGTRARDYLGLLALRRPAPTRPLPAPSGRARCSTACSPRSRSRR